MAYATGTTVTVEKSQAEIAAIVARFGAEAFSSGFDGNVAFVMFRAKNRYVRLTVPLPDASARRFMFDGHGRLRTAAAAKNALDAETRRRWRSLTALVKMKLAAVEDGIVEFEEEFLAHVILPDNRTVAQHARPLVERAYVTGEVRPLLPAPPQAG